MNPILGKPDHWTWSSKHKSRDVKIFGKEKRRIIFHPKWSSGTAGIRGNRVLNCGRQERIYWEVQLPDKVFGTSMMFGIGTSRSRLQANSFKNLIGEDDQSWGLSHKGLLWHNGVSRKFCKPFRENVRTTIGLMYDYCQGTLTYYRDGVKLGVAFRGLDEVSSPLYPLVSSTAAKTVMILCNMKVSYHLLPLKERCRYVILENLTKLEDISKLPLPPQLINYLGHPCEMNNNSIEDKLEDEDLSPSPTTSDTDTEESEEPFSSEEEDDIEMEEPKMSIDENLLSEIYPLPEQWTPKLLDNHQLVIN